ncbi:MAG: hypothetical protein R3221_12105 [Spongiibacter sp.]|uniref:ABC transporter permease n=1 Tax=Spongiibacter thalassae TaxID=2721624 RepID=A0ABX1GJC6_9GAMM|nr:hypothetical protein [Spongiibacter thalassae]MDX1506455.1 hypothetical protein [Spongiibacter sp.]NKI19076.1 hypothetical protein [Spongiibacter thalassae]
MGDVIDFVPRGSRPSPKGNSLCREGHHKWQVEKNSQFDVKQGKLVTVYRCVRCGKRKNTAH